MEYHHMEYSDLHEAGAVAAQEPASWVYLTYTPDHDAYRVSGMAPNVDVKHIRFGPPDEHGWRAIYFGSETTGMAEIGLAQSRNGSLDVTREVTKLDFVSSERQPTESEWKRNLNPWEREHYKQATKNIARAKRGDLNDLFPARPRIMKPTTFDRSMPIERRRKVRLD